MRLFVNTNRVSTAVKVKSGAILQVFPRKQEFSTEAAWSQHWTDSLQTPVSLVRKDEEQVEGLSVVDKAYKKYFSESPADKFGSWLDDYPKQEEKKYTLDDWVIVKQENVTMTLAPGSYYIGDLCIALNNNVYRDIFTVTNNPGIYLEKSLQNTFLTSYSAFGAGNFPCSDGTFFKCASGYLGICNASESMCAPGVMSTAFDRQYVRKFTFTEPVLCDFRDGRFTFTSGNKSFLIDTTGDDDGC